MVHRQLLRGGQVTIHVADEDPLELVAKLVGSPQRSGATRTRWTVACMGAVVHHPQHTELLGQSPEHRAAKRLTPAVEAAAPRQGCGAPVLTEADAFNRWRAGGGDRSLTQVALAQCVRGPAARRSAHCWGSGCVLTSSTRPRVTRTARVDDSREPTDREESRYSIVVLGAVDASARGSVCSAQPGARSRSL